MKRALAFLLSMTAASCSDAGGNPITPDTVLVEVPAAVSNEGHIRITFEALGNANGFLCVLDGNTPAPCISPFEADAGDGEHTFEVAAALNANADETPATHTWRIDTVLPQTALLEGPPALDNSLMPTFTFSGSDPAAARAIGDVSFECALDGAAFAACTSPHEVTVTDGAHEFSVRAKDDAGNVDASPAVHAWAIDSTAPDTMITAGPAAGSTSGPSGAFEFTSNEATATFECSVDGEPFTACVSPAPFTLGDGPRTFAVRAKDEADIVDPSPASVAWTVDAIAPAVTITQTPANPTNDTTPSFTFSAAEPATFECQIDGVATFTACTSPWDGPAVTDGNRTFRVRATDTAGNLGAVSTFGWLVDTVAPNTAISAGPTGTVADNDPSFSFTANPAGGTFQCSLDGAAFAPCTTPQVFADLADGSHTFEVRACDAVPNCDATPATRAWTIDTTPPATTIDTGPVAGSTTNDDDPSFTFSANPAAGATFECRLGTTGSFTACTSPRSFTDVADGAQTFAVRACDAVGNCDATPATRSWTIDTTPPATTIDTGPVAGSTTNDNDPSFTFSANPAAGATFECRLGTTGSFTVCTSPRSFTDLAEGPHTFAVRACDAVGNCDATPATRSWTIDTTPPIVTITQEPPASWPVNYADLEFSAPGATSFQCSMNGAGFTPCSSPHTATSGYATAQTFAVRAFDAVGNFSEDTATWTPVQGLVLHYPWEQGSTSNTSLLAQVPELSPNGPGTLPGANVLGGWAGTAIGNNLAAHKYLATNRPLGSSPDDTYTMSFWIRAGSAAASPNLISNHPATQTGGFRLSIVTGPAIKLEMFEQGMVFESQTALGTNRWVNIALRAKAGGMELFLDGQQRFAVATPSSSGFGSLQASELTIGGSIRLELDDLRFYNRSFADADMCKLVARGIHNAQTGQCRSLSPGLELDFETGIVHTGTFGLALAPPQVTAQFIATKTGRGVRFPDNAGAWGYVDGLKSVVQNLPGRSFSFWFEAGTGSGILWDSTGNCGAAVPVECGIRLSYASQKLTVFARASSTQPGATITIDVPPGMNSVVVTERRTGTPPDTTTVSLNVYVNGGTPVTMPIGVGDIYAAGGDGVRLVDAFQLTVDEYEFWGQNLEDDPEVLCENGFDGELDPADGTCALTSN